MISIALATYNGSKYLQEQLDSIATQTINDFEVIVCDDCSTDNTLQILQEFANKDSRFKIFQNKQNLGFKKNFEHLLSLCKGEFIAFCDQDDIWDSNHLETLFSNIGTCDCIGANALIVNEKLESLNKTHSQKQNIYSFPNTNLEILHYECYYNLIQGTASLFRKKLLKQVLPFPQNIEFHDHWIALNACVQAGCKYIPTEILKYRCHTQNITGFKRFQLFRAIQTIKSASKYRSEMYNSKIAMLQALLPNIQNKTFSTLVLDSMNFFLNLKANSNKCATILFYIKNYPSITRCPRRKIITFLYRTISLALFGIML